MICVNVIKKLRMQRGLKQAELAQIFGVRQNTLSTWETGKHDPDYDMLVSIAKYFDVSTDYLLGKTDDPHGLPSQEEMYDSLQARARSRGQSAETKKASTVGTNPEAERRAQSSLDEQLSDVEFALYGEVRELTDDEKRDILDYVRFKRAQKHGDSK